MLNLNIDQQINVLIGENGCGKSQILADLAFSEIDNYDAVLAIATSVFDKFPRRNFSKKISLHWSKVR
ncbi:ATP-binding protein [Shewanella psychrotolerans]|uniref:ATP-binding protein n=1 Tax=Shewanella psychrotolerans TaxID=2864206 RepID=UPI001C656BDA|nr:ATP-binding protein [Shewanella psychrotolerans]QYK00359.1 ATP-binding protein [Shewanella psychrotolerans]